jgi:hypothetical protein
MNGVRGARAAPLAGTGLVNGRSRDIFNGLLRVRDIFNGLLRVPVKEKIPALNSI